MYKDKKVKQVTSSLSKVRIDLKFKELNFLVLILAFCSSSTATNHNLEAGSSNWVLRYNCARESKLVRCSWPRREGKALSCWYFAFP